MAQRVEYILVDDTDQTSADETVRFSLDGVNYEIDLSSKNAAQLRDGLASYIGAARRNGGRRSRSSASTKAPTATQIRSWAADNGFDVSARGRVPANVRAAYERAHA